MLISNNRLYGAIALVLVMIMEGTFGRAAEGQWVSGNARFTTITPNCIRLEYSPGGSFVDTPSYFAVKRETRFAAPMTPRSEGGMEINTGAIRLTYKSDGKPFNAENLSAEIRKGPGVVTWKPGAPNPGNLGGTVCTLDQWKGPGDLGQGVLSRDGWFLLDDSRSVLLTRDWVEARPRTAGTDWYLFGYGDDYKAALKSLTAIGGDIPMPRKYTLGAWYSRYWPYTSREYRDIVKEYADHGFPLDVIVMDMDWHKPGWTGWSWNRTLLPDAEELLKWFHSQGLAVTLNVHPADGVMRHEDMYDAFMRDMGLDPVAKTNLLFDAGNKHYLDTLFRHTHDPLANEGVDFWWLDWQQYRATRSIPDLTNLAWLNHYYYQYTGRAGKRGVSFSRWAGWGDHRHPLHFSGDASTGWAMLAFEVPFTATAGNVGCFFWSHDIGGHMGGRNEESYVRWCQFGALSAALRSHSTRNNMMDRRPWTYPKWAEDSMRISFRLRSELFPYIYSSVSEACRDSIPLTRPMYIDYPGEDKAYTHPQQYGFGANLLVAPIVMAGVGTNRVGRQTVWFPGDDWYNYFTGEHFAGGREEVVSADINEFPLYVRGGVPLPMQPYTPHMGSAPLTTLVVRCYPGQEGKAGSSTLYEDDGISDGYRKGKFATTEMTCRAKDGRITVTIAPSVGSYAGQPSSRSLVVELPCTEQAVDVTIGGKPAHAVYDAVTCVNRIVAESRKTTEACIITASVKPVSEDVMAQRARNRRGKVDFHP